MYFQPERHLRLLERRGDVRRSTELLVGVGGGVRVRGAAVVEKHVERRCLGGLLAAAAVLRAGGRCVAAKAQPFREHQRL